MPFSRNLTSIHKKPFSKSSSNQDSYRNRTVIVSKNLSGFFLQVKNFQINIDVIQSSNYKCQSCYDSHYFLHFGYGFEIGS